MGLPKNWVEIEIGSVAQVVGGGTPKSTDETNFAAPGSAIAWITPADLTGYKQKEISFGRRDLSEKGLEQSSATILPSGSLLFSSRAPIGYVAIAKNPIATNQGFKSFIFPNYINSSYAFYYLKSIRDLADSRGTGTTFKELSGAAAKKLPFLLAPLNEQIRIANKLDSLLAKVDAAQARLEKIPALLKRFRQSVLAAATSGELTREWRGEQDASWNASMLKEICESISDGDHQAPPISEDGIPFLVISNVNKGKIDFDSVSRNVPIEYYDSLRNFRKPEPKDILYTVTGSFGIPVIVDTDLPFCFQRHIAIIKPNHQLVDYKYLAFWLASPGCFQHANEVATGTAQKTVSLTQLRNYSILVPSFEEQVEIVRRVESLFALADSVEKQYEVAKLRVGRLTQSLLAKAFRGELVPQDPNDEPASELLKRVSVELSRALPKKPKAPKSKQLSQRQNASESPMSLVGSVKKTAEKNVKGESITKRRITKISSRENAKDIDGKLIDEIYLKQAEVIERATNELRGKIFSIDQFRSVSGFDGDNESLGDLILYLLKGAPGIIKPLLDVSSWDEKTGEYALSIKEER